MGTARYIIGDTRDVTATLDDNSVDLILTSPPFLALRSYLPDDHPDKHREIGSEADPAAFVDMLLALTAEWSRVLAPHGSIAVELGDTYSGGATARAGVDRPQDGGYLINDPERVKRDGYGHNSTTGIRNMNNKIQPGGEGWPMAKSLALIPELYRIGLAYGRNPLTGNPSPAGRWRVRNVVRWVRPTRRSGRWVTSSGPPHRTWSSCACAKDRWFDLDAVRTEHQNGRDQAHPQQTTNHGGNKESRNDHGEPFRNSGNPAGAPPLDWWKISPGGYPGSHYAVFPPELCVKPIQAMCPREVCRQCGEPRRRIVEATTYASECDGSGRQDVLGAQHRSDRPSSNPTTIGWTDCGHENYRPGVVFDPFAGTGTTLAVATGHGRDAIGIDIDQRNADLAQDRIGMFCNVETHTP